LSGKLECDLANYFPGSALVRKADFSNKWQPARLSGAFRLNWPPSSRNPCLWITSGVTVGFSRCSLSKGALCYGGSFLPCCSFLRAPHQPRIPLYEIVQGSMPRQFIHDYNRHCRIIMDKKREVTRDGLQSAPDTSATEDA
jgi:hypothetical protein